MTTNDWLFLLGLLSILATVCLIPIRDEKNYDTLRTIVGVLLLCVGIFLIIGTSTSSGYKMGQVNAIKGKIEYKQQIENTYQDSTLIKSDTTYVKI